MSDMFQAIHIGKKVADPCPECSHSWHGNPCTAARCLCPPAFKDRYADLEETA